MAPYDFLVIGEPTKLSTGAQSVVGTLKARGTVSVQPAANVPITATVPDRPTVYSNYSH
jgi:hypothetical protein